MKTKKRCPKATGQRGWFGRRCFFLFQQRKGALFLLSWLVPEKGVACLEAFFSLVRSCRSTLHISHLCPLVYTTPLHTNRDGIPNSSFKKSPRHSKTKQFFSISIHLALQVAILICWSRFFIAIPGLVQKYYLP